MLRKLLVPTQLALYNADAIGDIAMRREMTAKANKPMMDILGSAKV